MLDTHDVHGGKRPGAGRHALGPKPMGDQYPLRCTHAERECWLKAAEREGKTLSAWMRDTLNAKAKS